MAEPVADLFAALSLRVNHAQWNAGDKRVRDTQRQLHSGFRDATKGVEQAFAGLSGRIAAFAGAAVAYFGAPKLAHALIGFNANLEDAHTGIAGMLALAKHTNVADQMNEAAAAVGRLQERAKTLPGTTQDYITTLKQITQPMVDAGASMQELEDLTVRTVIASRALGVDTAVGARDIDQAIRGQFHSVDQLTGKVLGGIGYKGEEGRSRFNALNEKARRKELQRAFAQPALDQLGDLQGKSLGGRFDTFKDNISIALGKVGLPLFERLSAALRDINAWFERNKDKIAELAGVIGNKLAEAWDAAVRGYDYMIKRLANVWDALGPMRFALEYLKNRFADAFSFIIEHETLFEGILVGLGIAISAFAIAAAIDWALAFWPVLAAIAAIAGIYVAVKKLGPVFRAMGSAFADAGAAIWDTIKSIGQAFADFGGAVWDLIVAIGRLGERIGAGIKDAFWGAIDWVVGKIEWAWGKVMAIWNFVRHPFGGFSPVPASGIGAGAPNNSEIGDFGSLPTVAIPPAMRPASTLQSSRATVVKPEVSVQIAGNMPPGWIDAKISTAIDDHHEATWRNADAALGGGVQ